MDERLDFNINDALKQYLDDPSTIPTPEAPSDLVDCEADPEALTSAVVNGALNPVVDAVAESPDAILRQGNFDTIAFLLKCAPVVPKSSQQYEREPDCELFKLSRTSSVTPPTSLSKVLDLIVSALGTETDAAHADIEAEEQESIEHHKQILEVLAFLLQWAITTIETKAAEKSASAPAGRGRGSGKSAKAKGGANKEANWDPTSQLTTALDVMSKVLKLKLARIFVTTSERDTFIGLFTRPVYLVLESEARVKNAAIKNHAFRIVCIAVKHHGHAFGKFRALALIG
jgi:condensin complex subunit 1